MNMWKCDIEVKDSRSGESILITAEDLYRMFRLRQARENYEELQKCKRDINVKKVSE